MANNKSPMLIRELLFPIIVAVLGGVLLEFFVFPVHFYELFIKKEKEISVSIKEPKVFYTKNIKLNGIESPNLFIRQAKIWNSGRKQISEFNVYYIIQNEDIKMISIFHDPVPKFIFSGAKKNEGDLSGYFVYELMDPEDEDTITFITTRYADLKIIPKGIDLEKKYVPPGQENESEFGKWIFDFVFWVILLVFMIFYFTKRVVKKNKEIEELKTKLSSIEDAYEFLKGVEKDLKEADETALEGVEKEVDPDIAAKYAAWDFLKIHIRLKLDEYILYGNWVTTNETFKAKVLELYNRLKNEIRNPIDKPILVLFCAKRGSGKTSLCRQLAVEILKDAKIIEFRTSKYIDNIQAGIKEHLMGIFDSQAEDNYLFVIFHEFDMKCGDNYLFSELIGPFSGEAINEVKTLNNVIYFFESYNHASVKEFEEKSRSLDTPFRMRDFLSLIPIENRIDIPDINDSWLERLIRGLSIFRQEAPAIRYFEKDVLLYIALTDFDDIFHLKDIIRKTCRNRQDDGEIIHWDDLRVPKEAKQSFIEKYPEVKELRALGLTQLV